MRWRQWLGVGERRWKKAPDEEVQPAKTLWDWLQLLIVPAILIGVTFAWSATQTKSNNKRDDRRIAADRAAAEEARRDATLQAYLDEMSGLMLDKKLLSSKHSDAVRTVARTVTLTALHRLNGERKAAVLRFLYEARLLGANPLIFLNGADLRDADLRDADLQTVNLAFADLRGANLRGASFKSAYLDNADLRDANLVGTDIAFANLRGGNLRGANLRGANLVDTELMGADLRGAILDDANLGAANLEGAKNLDLDRFITKLRPGVKEGFFDNQSEFLSSLSSEELANFNLTPKKLSKFRREAKTE